MPFVPTDIAGCKLWLKADALVLSDNDPVTTWTDLSGSGNDATQSTAGQKPLYKTAIQNGLPAVQFDNTDDGMATVLDLVEPYTIVVVEKPLSVASNKRTITTAITQNRVISGQRNNGNSVYLGGEVSSYGVGDTNAHILVLRVTGSGSTYWVDTVDRTTNSTIHAIWSQVNLGYGPLGETANTNIFEVVIYDSALSDVDRQSVESYLNTKYFVAPSTSLPLGVFDAELRIDAWF